MRTQSQNAARPAPQVVSVEPTPQQAYSAARAWQNELRSQISDLATRRGSIADRILRTPTGPDQQGLRDRLKVVDDQVIAVQKALAEADAAVAKQSAIPGAVVPPPSFFRQRMDPDTVAGLTALFIFVVFLPLSVAMARRIWRRGTALAAGVPREVAERLTRLEQAVESVAIEVERIGEGQRFMTNVLVDSVSERALGPGTMEAIPIKPREHAEHMRRE